MGGPGRYSVGSGLKNNAKVRSRNQMCLNMLQKKCGLETNSSDIFWKVYVLCKDRIAVVQKKMLPCIEPLLLLPGLHDETWLKAGLRDSARSNSTMNL